MMRRWLRTLPLYYFILLTLLMLFSGGINEIHFKWKYFFFLNNFTSKPSGFFGESWSLAIEEWFYILFSSTLFIVTMLRFPKAKKPFFKIQASKFFGVVLIIFIALIWIVKLLVVNGYKHDDVFTIVIFRLDAIAYGILAYWVFYTLKITQNNILLLFSLSFLFISVSVIIKFVYTGLTIFGMIYYLVGGLGYAGLVLALSLYPWRNTSRFVSHISKISYSIYITHLSLILLPLLKFCQPATLFQKTIFLFVYMIFTYFASIFTHRLIEKPFNKVRDHYFAN